MEVKNDLLFIGVLGYTDCRTRKATAMVAADKPQWPWAACKARRKMRSKFRSICVLFAARGVGEEMKKAQVRS